MSRWEKQNAVTPKLLLSNFPNWQMGLEEEDGAGVRVALLDSGLNWSNQAFTKARVRCRDFTGSGTLFDHTGHGTANAALLVGDHGDAATSMAPACQLLVAKVLGHREWKRTVIAVTLAIRWAVREGADVIVMPFGAFKAALSVTREIYAAEAAGCKIYAAAGNRGAERICFPAWLSEVTAVSALTEDGSIYPGCCARSDVDLFCWGDRVPVPGLGQYTELSGSSPATVLAAGIAILQIAARRRALHPLS